MHEGGLYASYLTNLFFRDFNGPSKFGGLLILGDPISGGRKRRLAAFHNSNSAMVGAAESVFNKGRELYPDLNSTGVEIIKAYGVPSLVPMDGERVHYVGADVNGPETRRAILDIVGPHPHSFVFCFLNCIFDALWFKTGVRLINGHPAVLPYARGIGAVEHFAAVEAWDDFERSVGATVHYMDEDIDTGPIILQARLVKPFAYESLARVRAHCLLSTFELMARVANLLNNEPEVVPVGIAQCEATRYRLFKRKERTKEVREAAAAAFDKERARREPSVGL
jgi:phosphoribosylglycinamide formyltransferase-1